MDINLIKAAKRFRYEWIFRNIDYSFTQGKKYAVLGPNGAGKSTLLKMLSGHLSPSKGDVTFSENGKTLDKDLVYKQVSYAAPYIDLIEDLELKEALQFHQRFKPFRDQLQAEDLIDLLQFSKSRNKAIKFFSSGMKQRLKLILAFCSDTSVLLLDEPTTNLDKQGMQWYSNLIEKYSGNRLLIVASNVETDYDFCEERLNILDYKKK